MSFVDLTSVDQVPEGTMKSFSIKNIPVLVANIGGKYYAIGNKCTHMGGDLSKGGLAGTVVTCPRHGSQFDVTNGNRVRGPAAKNEPAYEIKIDGKTLKINI